MFTYHRSLTSQSYRSFVFVAHGDYLIASTKQWFGKQCLSLNLLNISNGLIHFSVRKVENLVTAWQRVGNGLVELITLTVATGHQVKLSIRGQERFTLCREFESRMRLEFDLILNRWLLLVHADVFIFMFTKHVVLVGTSVFKNGKRGCGIKSSNITKRKGHIQQTGHNSDKAVSCICLNIHVKSSGQTFKSFYVLIFHILCHVVIFFLFYFNYIMFEKTSLKGTT